MTGLLFGGILALEISKYKIVYQSQSRIGEYVELCSAFRCTRPLFRSLVFRGLVPLVVHTVGALFRCLDVKELVTITDLVNNFSSFITQVDNLAGMTGQANKQLTEKMKKLESENKALKKGSLRATLIFSFIEAEAY